MAENIVANGVTYNAVDTVSFVNENGEDVAFYPDAVRYNAQELTEEQKEQARLNIGVVATLTPQMFGAKADGVTDDTTAINAAINAVPDGGTLYFPDGTYLVSETDSSTNNDRIAIRIDGRNNLTLLLANEAFIKHAPSTSAYYRTIRIKDSSHITIKGGHLVGESDTHTPTYNTDGTSIINTHGYGIRAVDSSYITIDGVDISYYYGDPIVLCSESTPYIGCNNVRIMHCMLHDSIRNGLTVTSCQELLVKDCEIFNITGALPMAGIDIEGEYEGATNENIIIDGCKIHSNGVQSIAAALTSNNVQIRNCQLLDHFTMSENASDLIISDSVITSAALRSNATVRNSNIYQLLLGAGDYSIVGCRFYADENSTDNVQANSTEVKARFIDCEFFSPESTEKTFYHYRGNSTAEKVAFNNCTFHMIAINVGHVFGATSTDFTGCTFIGETESFTKQFLTFGGTNALLTDCVFDASKLTSYTNYSGLISVTATNATVKNCIIKANSKLCTYAFNASSATGEHYYINNILPMWDSIGAMPTSASKLLVLNNVFSNTTEETEIDIDSIVEEVIAALPAAEEASF